MTQKPQTRNQRHNTECWLGRAWQNEIFRVKCFLVEDDHLFLFNAPRLPLHDHLTHVEDGALRGTLDRVAFVTNNGIPERHGWTWDENERGNGDELAKCNGRFSFRLKLRQNIAPKIPRRTLCCVSWREALWCAALAICRTERWLHSQHGWLDLESFPFETETKYRT